MAGTADVIVIGAGIIGCSIAYELARRGARVRVFESRSVGAGATQASAGVLAPYIEAPKAGPLLDLAVRSLAAYDQFIADVRRDADVEIEYRISGTLEIAADAEAEDSLRRAADSLVKTASLSPDWLDASAARAIEPTLPETIRGALLIREHGYVAASQLAEALIWAALRYGADVETGRRIASVRQAGSRAEVIADDGANWSADWVIVATGSWAGHVGISEPAARSVRPVRGQLIRLAWQGTPPRHVLWGASCYVVPWNDGTVLVGATVEDVGFDERVTAAGVRDLLEAACELLPAVWRATFQGARVGLRPASVDGLPIIGRSPKLPAVIYATGHYRNGILLAPVTSALIADLIIEARQDPVLESFRPDRIGLQGQAS